MTGFVTRVLEESQSLATDYRSDRLTLVVDVGVVTEAFFLR
jgi:hypothetical protein